VTRPVAPTLPRSAPVSTRSLGLDGDGLEMAVESVEGRGRDRGRQCYRKIERLGEDYAAALCGVKPSA